LLLFTSIAKIGILSSITSTTGSRWRICRLLPRFFGRRGLSAAAMPQLQYVRSRRQRSFAISSAAMRAASATFSSSVQQRVLLSDWIIDSDPNPRPAVMIVARDGMWWHRVWCVIFSASAKRLRSANQSGYFPFGQARALAADSLTEVINPLECINPINARGGGGVRAKMQLRRRLVASVDPRTSMLPESGWSRLYWSCRRQPNQLPPYPQGFQWRYIEQETGSRCSDTRSLKIQVRHLQRRVTKLPLGRSISAVLLFFRGFPA
jgi:hypothetical protein